MPKCPVKITMNIGNPHSLSTFRRCRTGGRARPPGVRDQQHDRVHPKAPWSIRILPSDLSARWNTPPGLPDPRSFFVEKMTEGVATIAAAFWPKR